MSDLGDPPIWRSGLLTKIETRKEYQQYKTKTKGKGKFLFINDFFGKYEKFLLKSFGTIL